MACGVRFSSFPDVLPYCKQYAIFPAVSPSTTFRVSNVQLWLIYQLLIHLYPPKKERKQTNKQTKNKQEKQKIKQCALDYTLAVGPLLVTVPHNCEIWISRLPGLYVLGFCKDQSVGRIKSNPPQ